MGGLLQVQKEMVAMVEYARARDMPALFSVLGLRPRYPGTVEPRLREAFEKW